MVRTPARLFGVSMSCTHSSGYTRSRRRSTRGQGSGPRRVAGVRTPHRYKRRTTPAGAQEPRSAAVPRRPSRGPRGCSAPGAQLACGTRRPDPAGVGRDEIVLLSCDEHRVQEAVGARRCGRAFVCACQSRTMSVRTESRKMPDSVFVRNVVGELTSDRRLCSARGTDRTGASRWRRTTACLPCPHRDGT